MLSESYHTDLEELETDGDASQGARRPVPSRQLSTRETTAILA